LYRRGRLTSGTFFLALVRLSADSDFPMATVFPKVPADFRRTKRVPFVGLDQFAFTRGFAFCRHIGQWFGVIWQQAAITSSK
jgi:hypothetical protein